MNENTETNYQLLCGALRYIISPMPGPPDPSDKTSRCNAKLVGLLQLFEICSALKNIIEYALYRAMDKLPLFSTQTRKRIAYVIFAVMLSICAGALGWVIVLQRSLPAVMVSPAFAIWIAVPFIILGSIAREEKAAREGRQIEVPKRPWLMLNLGILVLVTALGTVLMMRR